MLKRNGFWIGILAVVIASIGLGAWEVWGSYEEAGKARGDLDKKKKRLDVFATHVPRNVEIEAYKAQRQRAEEQFRKTREHIQAQERFFDDVYFPQFLRSDSLVRYSPVTLPSGEVCDRSEIHFEALERAAESDPDEQKRAEAKRKLEALFNYSLVQTGIEGRLEGLLKQLLEARLVAEPRGERDRPADPKAFVRQVFDLGHPQKGYSHPRQVVEAQKRYWVLSETVSILKETLTGAGELEAGANRSAIAFTPAIPTAEELRRPGSAGAPARTQPADEFFRRIRFNLAGRTEFSRIPDLVERFLKSPLVFRIRGVSFTRSAPESRPEAGRAAPPARPAAQTPVTPGSVSFTIELEVLDWEIPEAPWQR